MYGMRCWSSCFMPTYFCHFSEQRGPWHNSNIITDDERSTEASNDHPLTVKVNDITRIHPYRCFCFMSMWIVTFHSYVFFRTFCRTAECKHTLVVLGTLSSDSHEIMKRCLMIEVMLWKLKARKRPRETDHLHQSPTFTRFNPRLRINFGLVSATTQQFYCNDCWRKMTRYNGILSTLM